MGINQLLKKIISKQSQKLKVKIPVYIPVFQSNLLRNRVALITGATSGIGYAIANAFLVNGSSVIITGRDSNRIEATCEKLRSLKPEYLNERIYGLTMDMKNTTSFKDCFNTVLEELKGKRIDILVNNAGTLSHSSFGTIREKEYVDVLDTNLKGTYFLSQLISEYMINNKIRGNILNIASSSSLRPAISPYTLSKWGLRGLTLGLAKTLIKYDITVNGLAPGPTATPMLLDKDNPALNFPSNPTKRLAAPEEIANMAVILVSDIGRMIVGDIIYITGGSGLITFDDVDYNY